MSRMMGARRTRLLCASFLDLVLPEEPPHHSTISRTQRS